MRDLLRKVTGVAMLDCSACAAPIRFVMLDTGKRIPVNPGPRPADDTRANVCARVLGHNLHGYVTSKAHPADPLFLRFVPHFATCDVRKPTEDTALGLFDLSPKEPDQ